MCSSGMVLYHNTIIAEALPGDLLNTHFPITCSWVLMRPTAPSFASRMRRPTQRTITTVIA